MILPIIKEKRKPWYKNRKYDSIEEIHMMWWLAELLQAGYIKNYVYQPFSIDLAEIDYTNAFTTTGKLKERKVKDVSYTPDYVVIWSAVGIDRFLHELDIFKSSLSGKKKTWEFWEKYIKPIYPTFSSTIIDVKGTHDRNKGHTIFKLQRAFVYKVHGIDVQMAVPEWIFRETFVPNRYRFCDTVIGKERKINFEARTLNEFIDMKGKNNV